jgi:hypothetical protein
MSHIGMSLFGKEGAEYDLVVDLGPAEWYFCKQEEAMIPKILIGLLLGGAAGYGLSYITRSIGST